MPNVGIVASAVVPHIANKAAVWPNDVYAADPLMPAWATASSPYVQAARLTFCGFYPDPAFMDVWIGQKMTYNGVNYSWTGTTWVETIVSKVNLAIKGATTTLTDLSRIPIARRSGALNKMYTAVPSTPWAATDYAIVSHITPSPGFLRMSHIVQWDGTTWLLISTAPEYTGNPWAKTLTPGATAVMDTNITAADSTNAAKLTGLGYTMNPAFPAPGLTHSQSGVSFPGPTSDTLYYFYWNGTAWTSTNALLGYLYTNGTIANAAIESLPANQRVWAINGAHTSGGLGIWAPSTYATMGATQVHSGTGNNTTNYSGWFPGAAPGVVPPTPTKTALLPGDVFTTAVAGIPPLPPGSTASRNADIPYWFGGAGFRPHATEKLAWRAAAGKYFTYLNVSASWTGSHWAPPFSQFKTTLTPTTASAIYSKSTSGIALASVPEADRMAVMDSWYVASPLTAWTAGQYVWIGGVIVRWNGTAWETVAKPVTIHEAATYPTFPGDYYTDTRVTAQTAPIAANLLSWGYVPGYRAAWLGRTESAGIGTAAWASFSDPAGSNTLFTFSWNGTQWVAAGGGISSALVAVGATVTNAAISALPADEQITGCTMIGAYYSSTGAQWTTGQSATIAGNVVHWHGSGTRRFWGPGAAP